MNAIAKQQGRLYSAGGGVANPAWLEVAAQAGGGTPYYVPFKTACQAAYAWQYDDLASGFGCTPTSSVAGGATFSGFDVAFCPSKGLGDGTAPDRVVALEVRGRAAGIDRPHRGRLRIKGRTTLPPALALEHVTVTVTDLLDEAGGAGDLVAADGSTLKPRRRRKNVAVFDTDAGVEPRVKVVLRRRSPRAVRLVMLVDARRATIAPPTCDEGATVSLETAVVIAVGSDETRAGTVGPWRCRRHALRAM